ncbi:hypothetical protein F2P56_010200 [Juglans regia]|uniref:Glycoside hydrolase family 13 N-terminal domain-containing protein n=1 Tax=Juglans regia TaxID=51240 RepID=A0A834D2B3_JUGRE|nr:hypothetical protein F2P56_010200 [Juglans regia]
MVYSISAMRSPSVPTVCNWCRSTSNGIRNTNISLLPKKEPFYRKVFARMSSPDPDSSSLKVAASNKVLVPGGQGDGSLSLTDQLENPETDLEDHLVLHDVNDPTIEHEKKLEDEEKFVEPPSRYHEIDNEQDSASSTLAGEEASAPIDGTESIEEDEARTRTIPPPGTGQRIYEIDPLLNNYREHLDYRYEQYKRLRDTIDKYEGGLEVFSRGYEKFGFTRSATGITYREWAPGAKSAALIGDFNNWNPNADIMTQNEFGVWEIFLPNNADGSPPIPHGSRVKVTFFCNESARLNFHGSIQ